MANSTIKLSAEMLQAQSDQMKQLQSQYEDMFKQMENILQEMNAGWSENLSCHFVEKIALAQKGFTKMSELLQGGSEAARQAALGFTELNDALASQLSSILGLSDRDIEGLKENWAAAITDSGILDELIPEGASADDIITILSEAEEGAFGTEYIAEAKDLLEALDGISSGEISGDTIGTLADLFGGYDTILGNLGFSSGLSGMIVDKGTGLIFGDGKSIDSVSPAMVDYYDDMQEVNEMLQEGDLVNGLLSGFVRTIEGGTKITVEALGEIGGDIQDQMTDHPFFQGIVDLTGLDDSTVFEDINQQLIDSTGIDFSDFPQEFGKEMYDVFSERVDATVEGIPVVTEYIGEQLERFGSGIIDGFASLKNYF